MAEDNLPTRTLTPKQERFVNEYMIDLNGTQAAIRAGYSTQTAQEQGSRLLSNVMVASVIAERQAELAAKAAVTQEYVLTSLKDVVSKAMQAEPVFDKFGNPTGEFVFDSKGAVAALQLLGKHRGMFVDKKEILLTNNFDVSKLSTEEIRAELNKQRKIAELALNTIDVTVEDDSNLDNEDD